MTAPVRPINLNAEARKVDVDNRIPLHFYYRIADNLLKQVFYCLRIVLFRFYLIVAMLCNWDW